MEDLLHAFSGWQWAEQKSLLESSHVYSMKQIYEKMKRNAKITLARSESPSAAQIRPTWTVRKSQIFAVSWKKTFFCFGFGGIASARLENLNASDFGANLAWCTSLFCALRQSKWNNGADLDDKINLVFKISTFSLLWMTSKIRFSLLRDHKYLKVSYRTCLCYHNQWCKKYSKIVIK